MGRKMTIEWPKHNVTVTAVLEDERNPELCNDVWAALPFDAVQEHGVVTGKIIYCWVPVVSTCPVHYAEKHSDAHEGRVSYSQGTGNKIIINYGFCTEDLYAPALAMIVPEDIEKLKAMGREIWDVVYNTKEIMIVKFARKED